MSDQDAAGTILEAAATGQVTAPILAVAQREGRNPRQLLKFIAKGSVVIMRRGDSSLGIGESLRTKVNVNIGSSHTRSSLADEVKKAEIAEKFGADTISDLSTGGDIPKIRETIFKHTRIPITTVPVYQAAAEFGIETLTTNEILATIREQAAAGVSSMVLHCMTKNILNCLKRQTRILGVVSKGGAIIGSYMHIHHCENPYIEMIDDIIGIFRKHDIVLSLGNTARSGCIHDSRDEASKEELKQNIAIARYAHERGVR
jgi:phosphomethylpyrimidine synthase